MGGAGFDTQSRGNALRNRSKSPKGKTTAKSTKKPQPLLSQRSRLMQEAVVEHREEVDARLYEMNEFMLRVEK